MFAAVFANQSSFSTQEEWLSANDKTLLYSLHVGVVDPQPGATKQSGLMGDVEQLLGLLDLLVRDVETLLERCLQIVLVGIEELHGILGEIHTIIINSLSIVDVEMKLAGPAFVFNTKDSAITSLLMSWLAWPNLQLNIGHLQSVAIEVSFQPSHHRLVLIFNDFVLLLLFKVSFSAISKAGSSSFTCFCDFAS